MLGAAGAALVVAVAFASLVPSAAWSPGSAELSGAPRLDQLRVLHAETGLTIEPLQRAVLVSTGDGGGVGRIDGFASGILRVREASFRGEPGWEVGTRPGAPAAYFDDNGVRLDDGMIDRVRARAWPLALWTVMIVTTLLVSRRRRAGR